MLKRLNLRLLALTLALAMTPLAASAQESPLNAQEPDPQPANPLVEEEQPVSDSVAEVLASSTYHAALLAPPAVDLPTAEELSIMDEQTPAAAAAPSKGSGTGLGFMIGGAAALVGGLLIGGTGGNIIAAGGVALGVYGAIVYF
jgi:hypothetical protein